jgi:hypothetical protein
MRARRDIPSSFTAATTQFVPQNHYSSDTPTQTVQEHSDHCHSPNDERQECWQSSRAASHCRGDESANTKATCIYDTLGWTFQNTVIRLLNNTVTMHDSTHFPGIACDTGLPVSRKDSSQLASRWLCSKLSIWTIPHRHVPRRAKQWTITQLAQLWSGLKSLSYRDRQDSNKKPLVKTPNLNMQSIISLKKYTVDAGFYDIYPPRLPAFLAIKDFNQCLIQTFSFIQLNYHVSFVQGVYWLLCAEAG